jgi:hypothetical protein
MVEFKISFLEKLILVDQTGKSAGRDDIMKAPIKAKEVRFG